MPVVGRAGSKNPAPERFGQMFDSSFTLDFSYGEVVRCAECGRVTILSLSDGPARDGLASVYSLTMRRITPGVRTG